MNNMGTKADIRQKITPITDLKEPPLYRIIYMNDDVTTVEFVISSLIEYFDYNFETATALTKNIHEQGSAVVAILPYEIAEQKGIEVVLDARTQGYPLEVKVEAEK
jgi:ATP-dependent Clp protease adaptor protein ClpS